MQEKDIKRLATKQLKKKFPHWNRLSKKGKKKLAFSKTRSQKYLKDPELKTIDKLLGDSVINQPLEVS